MNANLSYSFTDDGISDFIWVEDYISYTSYFNISKEKRWNLSTYLNWSPTTKLRLFGNLSGSYVDLKTNNGTNLRNSGFSSNVFGAAQYTLPWDMLLALNSAYAAPNITLQGESMTYCYYGLSASKSLLNKKLNIRISAINPFQKNLEIRSVQRSPDFYFESLNYMPFRNYSLTVSYRFGEMKSQIKKTKRSIQNDDQMQTSDKSEGAPVQP
jgi:hypothetical protein